MTMKRDQALTALAEHYADGIVVPVFQSAFDWMKIRPHALNYLCTGAMGQASSHALGIALACPDEQVLVLDGDGSLLMNLGCLVTTAEQSPKNLWHFVSKNGIYEVNGEFPVPGKDVDFAALAAAAGFKRTYSFSDIDEFRQQLPEVLAGVGPVFVSMDVETGEVHPRDYVTIHSAESRHEFRTALQDRLAS
ncbi:MAG: sulfopyruvate decarboxylase subunit beta [Parasphingorhabdus sp.]|jgi:sulfopyruvate decarboxylase subunit beta